MRHGPKGVDSVWRLIGVPGAAEVKYNVHGARAFVDVKSRFWQSDYGIVGHSAIDINFVGSKVGSLCIPIFLKDVPKLSKSSCYWCRLNMREPFLSIMSKPCWPTSPS